ncbi:anhydro-N-acetylmuramic acid kinase [Mucilaginibacter ginsenosidivorax]|uniref:Anhydro-N-acetylmuramic acid kinase n=1 Tax=Mucilaginibacter ginsenosidivorax TaxID=862126 RepID=A0A5B8VX62_9SPHI|nr:anhydro-N-acetylmuramic acid kinase [Mucilaginibacter ginsenosidivorax]QEC76304.1 anhydro-N-acetylmuramic acid kinase [Mucilaginibacter ginsenosidivorax]
MLPLNQNLQKLFDIAQKPVKTVIGLMSGTSLDGLDIALCSFSGHGLQTQYKLLQFITIPYPEGFKSEVQQVFAKKTVDLEKLTLLNAYIGSYHGELVLQALSKWDIAPDTVDFIASHGQTIYHAPKRLHKQANYPNATLQIGDGDHLAVKTGILTISDFRQKHIAAGGEGAPLALYGDVLLGHKPGEERILLNIGGIANLTYLPANNDTTNVLCTDVGPGNTLVDAACRRYFNKAFDEDSAIANSGKVNHDLLTALLSHPFFLEAAPKTTGPELFNLAFVENAQQQSQTKELPPEDLVSTLSAFTATSIINFIKANIQVDNLKIFVSGGGARNPFVITQLKLAFENIKDTSSLGINPDAKEAILFALLGNEALCGEPIVLGDNPKVLMGKFSFAV